MSVGLHAALGVVVIKFLTGDFACGKTMVVVLLVRVLAVMRMFKIMFCFSIRSAASATSHACNRMFVPISGVVCLLLSIAFCCRYVELTTLLSPC